MRIWLTVLAFVVLVLSGGWASDAITWEGERTVYTVDCQEGRWEGSEGATCSGRMVAGDRFRFRALVARGEVLFWTSGQAVPSEKFSGCHIEDGRNWTCPRSELAAKTVTLRMRHGNPVPQPGDGTKPFHAVSKMRWWLAKYGLSTGRDADN